MNAREAAYLSLVRCEGGSKYSNIEIDSAIKKYKLTDNERSLFTVLVYGVIERKISLDYFLGKFSSRPIEKIESNVMQLLRIGTYQIIYLDRVPDSAACNETVELAKKYTHKGTSGFVNGILRSITRGKDNLPYPQKDTAEYYSVFYSCPMWLIDMWREQYGDEKCRVLLEGMNRNPKITLRVNTLKITRDELVNRLLADGIEAEPTALSPFGITLLSPTPISEIKPLVDGLCFVQDEASQLCVSALGICHGETVIDACACPGGKSFSAAMCMENSGQILSFDLHESKLSLIRSGAEKLGIDIITARVQDGSSRCDELVGKADRVLCDVPCSGLGVIAKKPDLRYKSPDDIKKLPEIQYSILKNCSSYVKSGGILIYSTCTVNMKENDEVVDKFISENNDFEPCSDGMPFDEPKYTFFSGEHGTDGFFIAKFRKKK